MAELRDSQGDGQGRVPGAFHRLRLGFASANVDNLDADLLQRPVRHRLGATTKPYIAMAKRVKRAGTADKLRVPRVFKTAAS